MISFASKAACCHRSAILRGFWTKPVSLTNIWDWHWHPLKRYNTYTDLYHFPPPSKKHGNLKALKIVGLRFVDVSPFPVIFRFHAFFFPGGYESPMMFVSFLKSKGKSKNSSVEPCCCQRSLHYEARQETSHPKYMPSVSHKVSGLKHPQTKVETSSYTHHIPLLSLLTFQVMIGLSSWKPLKIQIWWARGAMGLNLAGTGCESAIPTALVSRHPRSTDPKPIQLMKQFWIGSTNQSIIQSISQSINQCVIERQNEHVPKKFDEERK